MTTAAGSVDGIKYFSTLEELLAEIDKDEQALKTRIETKVAGLKSRGGKVRTLKSGTPVVGCGSLEEYKAAMKFLMYGKGTSPLEMDCGKLKPGADVVLKECDTDTGEICKFKSGWFSSYCVHIGAIKVN